MSQLFVLTMLPFWVQPTAIPPSVETDTTGLAEGSLSLLTRNSSPRELPSALNRRPNISAVYRGTELVTTMSPAWLIGAVVGRSPTQTNAKPPSDKAAVEGDRWLRVVG